MTERKLGNKRIAYIETLRIVCAIAVIGIHITMTQPNNLSIWEIGASNYMVLTCVYSLVQWAVPVFLMISGALLLNSKSLNLNKVKKYIIRMLLVLLIFGTAYALMELVFNARTLNVSMVFKAILYVFERRSWSHLWYIYVLIGIYFILIPLQKMVQGLNSMEARNFIGILIVGNFIIPTINSLSGTSLDTFMALTQYVTYFLLGYYLYGEFDVKRRQGTYIVAFIVASMIKVVSQIIAVYMTGEGTAILLEDRILTLVQAVSIYLLFKNGVNSENSRIVKSISRCSFGIYLIHPFFINLFYKVLDITPTSFGVIIFSIPVLWAAVFLLSWFATWVLIKIPGIAKIV